MSLLIQFAGDESGATVAEYAILVSLVAMAVIAIVLLIGRQLDVMYGRVVPCVRDPANCQS